MPKRATNERFKIIPTVYLILVNDNKILLSRRCNTGFYDGYYSLPAGHLDGNETMVKAMMREAKEELGIGLDSKYLKLVHILHRKESTEERINLFFTTEKWKGNPRIMEPHKCDDLEWFEMDYLPNNVVPYLEPVLNSFRNKIFYGEFGW